MSDRLTLFTPREVEAITGLTTAMQRDWRSRGYLPVVGKHARFDVFDLARIAVLKMCSDRGLVPSEASKLVEFCVVGIVFSALNHKEAYQPEADWASADRLRISLDSIRKSIIREKTGQRIIPARYLVIFADGKHIWEMSVDNALFDADPGDPRTCGPILVFDLRSIGEFILSRAGKHLVHVDFSL